MSVFVIGADRGFSAFGYALFELFKTTEVLVEAGVIETKKANKKANVLASSDNHRRTQELWEALEDIFGRYESIYAAAAESTSLPRNAGASYKIGRADSVYAVNLISRAIPLAEASPQAVKKALCGKASVSKQEVQRALERMYPGQFDEFKAEYAKGKWEHGFDAAAAVVACLNSQVFLMARQLVRG
jgi:crossover junction endodeoxyribonuclease RuvC